MSAIKIEAGRAGTRLARTDGRRRAGAELGPAPPPPRPFPPLPPPRASPSTQTLHRAVGPLRRFLRGSCTLRAPSADIPLPRGRNRRTHQNSTDPGPATRSLRRTFQFYGPRLPSPGWDQMERKGGGCSPATPHPQGRPHTPMPAGRLCAVRQLPLAPLTAPGPAQAGRESEARSCHGLAAPASDAASPRTPPLSLVLRIKGKRVLAGEGPPPSASSPGAPLPAAASLGLGAPRAAPPGPSHFTSSPADPAKPLPSLSCCPRLTSTCAVCPEGCSPEG